MKERPMPKSAADYRWTEPKMLDFLRHLARSGSVTDASMQVGMSRQSAYNRARADGGFTKMWDRAVVLSRMMRVTPGDAPLAR